MTTCPLRFNRLLPAFFLLTAWALGTAIPSASYGQRRPPRGEPHIDFVFPTGAQRGTTIEATMSGQNLIGAHLVRVNGKGVTGSVVKVVDARNVKVSLSVAPDAQIGEREIRLMTPVGISNRFRFVVGQLPEIVEKEPNSVASQAQPLESLPVLVNGQIMPGDCDFFRFAASAGQTLVFQVEARKLLPYLADAVPGWNDVCLTLYDADGRQVTSVDDFRFKPDPVLIFKVPKDGEYLIEARDIIFRGRGDFVYRMSIGTLPYLTHVYPLGAKRNTTAKVELFGVNLPAQSLDAAIPGDSPAVRNVNVTGNGMVSNSVPFAAGDAPEIEEKEPNDSISGANRVDVGTTINGRIQRVEDEDHFVFTAQAGQRLLLEVYARRLDSPLDSLLTLFNAKEQELTENDDNVDIGEALVVHHADARLVYTIPANGDHTVRIRDIQSKGGPEYAYRLVIAPVRPDFYLHISPDNPHMGQGDNALITVTAVRKDGFNGEIALTARDLPKGFKVSDAVIPANQIIANMTMTSPSDVPMGFLSPTIVGTATVDKETITRQALPAEEQTQAFAYRHTVPTQELLLAVMETPPFTLSVDLPAGKPLEVPQGGEAQVVFKVKRRPPEKETSKPEAKPAPKPGAKPEAKPAPKEEPKSQIVLSTGYPAPPPGISIKTAFITPEMNEIPVTILAARFARADIVQNLIVTGTMLTPGRPTVYRIAPAIPVKVVVPPAEGNGKKKP